MPPKFQRDRDADDIPESVILSPEEAKALGLVQTKTITKRISIKKAKELAGGPVAEPKPKKPLTEGQLRTLQRLKEAREAKREAKLKELEEALRAREAEEKRKAEEAEKRRKADEEAVRMGLKVKIPVLKPKGPRKIEKPLEITPSSDDTEDDDVLLEEESEEESEEEVAPPPRASKQKAKVKAPPVIKKQYKADPSEDFTELSDYTDIETIKTKKVLVPKPVKEKVRAIKAIDSTIRKAQTDPSGWGDLIRSRWS